MSKRKESVYSSKHSASIDTDGLNNSVGQSISNQTFIERALSPLQDLTFPAFKEQIINHAANSNVDDDILSLYQTLNGYEAYRDINHIRDAFEVNRPRVNQYNNSSPDEFVSQGYRESPAHTVPEPSRQSTPKTRNIEETKTNIEPDGK